MLAKDMEMEIDGLVSFMVLASCVCMYGIQVCNEGMRWKKDGTLRGLGRF